MDGKGVLLTSRTLSEVTFRLLEYPEQVLHLVVGVEHLAGTVLDGELVCPVAKIDTGSTLTTSSLQATVSVLATSPEAAKALHGRHQAHLEFHVFDILRLGDQDVTAVPLSERLPLITSTTGG